MKVETLVEQLLFSTTRIETNLGVGTGFILQAELNNGKMMTFLITNKHVIKCAKQINFFFTESDSEIPPKNSPFLGKKLYCTLNETDWFNHPDENVDLTLTNLSTIINTFKDNGVKLFVRSIPANFIPNQKDLEEFDALENILFIGYPIGLYDSKNLLPIIRTGITATSINIDYGGNPIFLIDASVFPGSSGSPVFIYDKSGFKTRSGNTILGGERIYFCGVISKWFFKNDEGKIEFKEIPAKLQPVIKKSESIDLGMVIKARMVEELVENYLNSLNLKK